jgi:hypothetical protein
MSLALDSFSVYCVVSHVPERLIHSVLDAPARAMVANVNQLNGERNMMVVGILLTPELELRKEMVMFRSIKKKLL